MRQTWWRFVCIFGGQRKKLVTRDVHKGEKLSVVVVVLLK